MAQFGRALRSGRRGRKFESCRLDSFQARPGIWPHGQAVKTTPSHGVNSGSIPDEVIESRIKARKTRARALVFCFIPYRPYEKETGKFFAKSFPVSFQLGQRDSNPRVQQSKCCALPLGDGPMVCINQTPDYYI